MKTSKWNRLGFILATLVILTGNLIGISALATENGNALVLSGPDDPPAGVLVGYTPAYIKVKTGEHFEYFGWVGAPFARLVNDYSEIYCCKRTYRSMDGCKDLKVCPEQS